MMKWILKKIKKILRYWDYRNRSIYVASGSFVSQGVVIGDGTRINHISHIGDCSIGKYCAIGGRLIIRSTDNYTCYANMQSEIQKKVAPSIKVAGKSKGDVRIGNAVWIGDSVIVLPGVNIGDGAVIGAGSVVTKDIPPFSIAVGNPCKVIKYRFSKDKIDVLMRIKWWDWDVKKMKRNSSFFSINVDDISYLELLEYEEKYK